MEECGRYCGLFPTVVFPWRGIDIQPLEWGLRFVQMFYYVKCVSKLELKLRVICLPKKKNSG